MLRGRGGASCAWEEVSLRTAALIEELLVAADAVLFFRIPEEDDLRAPWCKDHGVTGSKARRLRPRILVDFRFVNRAWLNFCLRASARVDDEDLRAC